MLLCAGHFEPTGRHLDSLNLCLMSKISYAGCTALSAVILAHFALEMCVAAQNRPKIHKNTYFGIQGHPKSLILVQVESQCTTSYSD